MTRNLYYGGNIDVFTGNRGGLIKSSECLSWRRRVLLESSDGKIASMFGWGAIAGTIGNKPRCSCDDSLILKSLDLATTHHISALKLNAERKMEVYVKMIFKFLIFDFFPDELRFFVKFAVRVQPMVSSRVCNWGKLTVQEGWNMSMGTQGSCHWVRYLM